MYRLRNAIGNVYRVVKKTADRDRLLAQGYVEVTAPTKPAKKASGAKKAVAKEDGDTL